MLRIRQCEIPFGQAAARDGKADQGAGIVRVALAHAPRCFEFLERGIYLRPRCALLVTRPVRQHAGIFRRNPFMPFRGFARARARLEAGKRPGRAGRLV